MLASILPIATIVALVIAVSCLILCFLARKNRNISVIAMTIAMGMMFILIVVLGIFSILDFRQGKDIIPIICLIIIAIFCFIFCYAGIEEIKKSKKANLTQPTEPTKEKG